LAQSGWLDDVLESDAVRVSEPHHMPERISRQE
jgi:hypothetical protein